MGLVDCHFKDIVAMTAKTPPELGGSTAALLSSLLGIAMCKMALLTSAKKRFANDVTVARLDDIAMDITSALDKDQMSVKHLIETLTMNGRADEKRCALIEATRHPLAACHMLVDATEALVSARAQLDKSVTSDYYGGVALIVASYRAVTLAVDANLETDLLAEMRQQTAGARAELQSRLEHATKNLGLS